MIVFRRTTPRKVDSLFRILQLFSSAVFSLGHGSNDAQKTMGSGLTHLRPVQGFCAETAGALTIIGSTLAGIPVSTTHTITGSIMGVGLTKGVSSVRCIRIKMI
jgi:PiT family inorganic phosphate transporter